MKKLFGLILSFILLSSQAFAISEWDVTQIAGSNNASDIDAYSIANAQAQDRLLIGYRKGLGVNYASAGTLTILTGEIAIPNSDGSVVRYRRLTANSSVSFSDIDTGVEASNTTYYVYALGDTAATTPTFCISLSASAPTGKTYYVKIAQFKNDNSSNITDVLNYRTDYGTDYPDVGKAWVNFTGTGTVTINDQYNVSSVTDNGTGDFTINFATSFGNSNYVPVLSGKRNSDGGELISIKNGTSPTTSSAEIECRSTADVLEDPDKVYAVFFGDRT